MKISASLLGLLVMWLCSAGPQGKFQCPRSLAAAEKSSCKKAGVCSRKKAIELPSAANTHQAADDCSRGGVCNPFQVCVYCCCLPVEKVCLPEPVISTTRHEKVRPGYIDAVSHFAGDFFQPPEGMV